MIKQFVTTAQLLSRLMDMIKQFVNTAQLLNTLMNMIKQFVTTAQLINIPVGHGLMVVAYDYSAFTYQFT